MRRPLGAGVPLLLLLAACSTQPSLPTPASTAARDTEAAAFALVVPSDDGLTLSKVGLDGQWRSSATLGLLPATLAPGDQAVAYSGKRFLAASVMVGGDQEIDVYDLAVGAGKVAAIPTDVEELVWGPDEQLAVFSVRPMTMTVFDGSTQRTATIELPQSYLVHQPSWSASGSGVIVAEVDSVTGLAGTKGVLGRDGRFQAGTVAPYVSTGLEPVAGPDGSTFAVRPFNPRNDMSPTWVTVGPDGQTATWHIDRDTSEQWYWANWLSASGPAVALAQRGGALAIGMLNAPDEAGTWQELGVGSLDDADVQLRGLATDGRRLIGMAIAITRGDTSELELFRGTASGMEQVGETGLSGALFAGFARQP